jgi:photosystem II stability/assembly factor-like uncharacterized protein
MSNEVCVKQQKILWGLILFWFVEPCGAQWTDLTNAHLGNIRNMKFISPTNGWLINLSNTGPQGLLKTTDGGYTWRKILDHPPGVFRWLEDFDFYGDSLGYAMNIYALTFWTRNGGRTWDTLISNQPHIPNSMIFHPTLAYSGGTYLYKSIDSLRNWSFVGRVPDYGLYPSGHRLAFLSRDTIVACGGSQVLLKQEWTGTFECNRSTNAGLTWQLTFFDTMWTNTAVVFANGTTGYAFSILRSPAIPDPHAITLKTDDGGAMWYRIPSVIPVDWFDVAGAYFQNPDVGFVCGVQIPSGAGLAKTTNGGVAWQIVQGVTGDMQAMSWPDSVHGWVAGRDGKLYRTTNGGGLPIVLASFTARHLGGTRVRLDWRTLSETNNYGFFVQRRRASDTSFTEISSLIPGYGTTNEPHDYTWTDTNATIARWYYRLKQVDLGGPVHFTEPIVVDVTTGVGEVKSPFEFRLEQNYPNPFNPTTKIGFKVQRSGLVSLKVVDVLGREVATLVSEVKKTGTYDVEWNAENFPSGVYFYRLTAGEYTRTMKMLLVR